MALQSAGLFFRLLYIFSNDLSTCKKKMREIDMIQSLETTFYNEIIEAYESRFGTDLTADPFVYHEIRKIVDLLKDKSEGDREKLKKFVTNSITFILMLFFEKNEEDLDDGEDLEEVPQTKRSIIKDILADVLDATVKSA